jgi:hypothetical protein
MQAPLGLPKCTQKKNVDNVAMAHNWIEQFIYFNHERQVYENKENMIKLTSMSNDKIFQKLSMEWHYVHIRKTH